MSRIEILAIVPARGGSKGIERKNIRNLSGTPLLGYTAMAALESKHINRAIVSTDDPEIALVAQQYGLEVPFLRPAYLAQDDSPSLPVFQFTLNELKRRENYIPNYVVVLQPTSPFRKALHIDAAIQKYINSVADSLVSVVKIQHNMSPFSAMKMELDGYLNSLEGIDELNNQRQNKPIFYARNGAAIYITTPKNIIENNSLYGKNIIGYEMNKLDSIDIDDEEDWVFAEALISWRVR